MNLFRSKRFPDWQSRFQAVLAAKRDALFDWGTNDCALFAADCVCAVTGDDLGEPFRGRYHDARGATELLSAHGGLGGIADSCLEPRPVAMARVADVGLALLNGHETLAVYGGNFWLGPGKVGITSVSPLAVIRTWGVG